MGGGRPAKEPNTPSKNPTSPPPTPQPPSKPPPNPAKNSPNARPTAFTSLEQRTPPESPNSWPTFDKIRPCPDEAQWFSGGLGGTGEHGWLAFWALGICGERAPRQPGRNGRERG